jgi:acetoacetyl-CoA synthetase
VAHLPQRQESLRSSSQVGEFIRCCERRTGERFTDHGAFHAFSVDEGETFWRLFLDWSRLAHEGAPEPVITSHDCERARFFPNLRLNYVENLLHSETAASDQGAIVACSAHTPPAYLTRGEVRDAVLRLAGYLRTGGIGAGSRVVMVAGNNAEAVIACLAAATVGATFSSASPEMGVPALVSRFGQLEPAALIANLFASTASGPRALDDHIGELVRRLPSLRTIVALDDGPLPAGLRVPVARLTEIEATGDASTAEPWVRRPFNHPLFVMFTSGTTGRPKCIVHGAGGTLLEHVKEHRLHVDLRPGERLLFHTSAAWMMWNWQLSALASGAEIVLYDGPVRDPSTLWEIVRRQRVGVFGTSPPYLQLCEDTGYTPPPLPHLRALLSTGSILHDWQYDWVREHVGPIPVQSISGGTDIIGCFVLGHPDLAVTRGLIQCRSLGLDVQAVASDADADHDLAGDIAQIDEVGELVCRNPFPSRPLGFYEDDGTLFHKAYFSQHPGVWTHGDLIEFSEDGQARMHGRSDGVLNIRGDRIGPAEIYRAIHGIPDVREAMAIEVTQPGGEAALALLVVLRPDAVLDAELAIELRRAILGHASANHVPALVVAVDELPVTHSGKRSERAASDAANGRTLTNPETLANPESLDSIRAQLGTAIARQRDRQAVAGRRQEDSTEARVIELWEAILGIPVARDDNFFDLGATSLTAVRLLQAIHDRIGIELPPAVLVVAQTPAQLAALIDGPPDSRSPILVPLRAGTADRPLFLVHALGGDVLHLRPLALALDTNRPVHGLQARGLDPRFEPHTTVEEMAASYVQVIRATQASGPVALAGYSLGGLVAFEMARVLQASGTPVDTLALIDSDLHVSCLSPLGRARFRSQAPGRYARHVLADPRARVPLFTRKALHKARLPVEAPRTTPLPPRLQRLHDVGWGAFAAYRPQPYDGVATLFVASTRYPAFCDPAIVWPRYVGELSVARVSADHESLVSEPTVGPLAAGLSTLLAAPPTPGI